MNVRYTLRNPRIAVLVTIFIGAAVWGTSQLALTSVFEFTQASALRKNQVSSYITNLEMKLDAVDETTYQPDKEYISETVHTKNGFNALGMKISEDTPVDTRIDIFIRAGDKENWGEWIEIERDVDGFFSEQREVFAKLIPVSSAHDFQFKVHLHTENPAVTPTLHSLEIVYINSKGYWTTALPVRVSFLQRVFAADPLGIISRKAWGANEKLRVLTEDRPEPQLAKITQDVIEQFASENPIVKRVKKNEDGEILTWPLEYTATVDKIIIHHTAKQIPKTDQDAVNYMRAVYAYHTISRGWGDIGYNYVIDPFGRIYEGRAGGDKVVGAHAGLYNRGAVGIALMGDFDQEQVSPAQLRSLIQLVNALSKKYGIDPTDSSMFRGQLLPNVSGHKDVGSTSCPGGDLYSLLPSLRKDAANSADVVIDLMLETPAFIEEADKLPPPVVVETEPSVVVSTPVVPTPSPEVAVKSADVGAAIAYGSPLQIDAKAGDSTDVTVRIENKGTVTWNSNTYLESILRYPSLVIGTEHKITMQEAQVLPGGTGTFIIPIQVLMTARERYALSFDIVVNGFERVEHVYRLTAIIEGTQPNSAVYENDMARTELVNVGGPEQIASSSASAEIESEALREIRVKLGIAQSEVVLTSPASYTVYVDGEKMAYVSADDETRLTYSPKGIITIADGKKITAHETVRLVPSDGKIMRVVNFERRVLWDDTINDNEFRGTIEVRSKDALLQVINELPLEEYLYGLGEVSEAGTHNTKKEVMSIVARSYALFYMTEAQKFPGEPYHLDDSASTSQKYLGYGFEARSPQWRVAVDTTRGLVVTYDKKIVKTPYFSQSDGRTRSPEEVWGWSAPYLQSVPDPLCAEKIQLGHGVGLSGCGAEQAARKGYSSEEILKYYYKGIELTDLY